MSQQINNRSKRELKKLGFTQESVSFGLFYETQQI